MKQKKLNDFEEEVINTSLEAYDKIRKDLAYRQLLIYDFIKLNPDLTAFEICHKLGFSDPNRVRPRINELFKSGFIFCPLVRVCKITGFNAKVWRLVTNKR